jgi:hypothetical protein
MLFSVWVPFIVQFLVATGLLCWLAFGKPASRMAWLLRALLVAAYVTATGIGGLWLVLPWWMPFLFGGLLAVAGVRSVRRWRGLPDLPPSAMTRTGTVAVGALLAFSLALTAHLLSGWRSPADAVELSFPLRGGPYLIVNGGGNQLINAHLATLEGERFRPWRGESYGVDIVKVDGLGLRASGILPADPARYEIFGDPLYAPCSGRVLTAVDGVAELPPPTTDRQNMAGNHIILECGDIWVLLGHMQRGSVEVRQGNRVAAGQRVGRVGNTGNTNEPHLHIHAQRPGTAQAPLSGDPLPIRFGDRYPVRNALFTIGAADPASAGLSVSYPVTSEVGFADLSRLH